jgi:hypothetical protein
MNKTTIPKGSYALSNRFKQNKYLKYDDGGNLMDLNDSGTDNGLNVRSNSGASPAGQAPAAKSGGGITSGQISAISAGASSVGDAINAGGNNGTTIGGSALKGAAAGASMGAVAGPWGAAIGAVVGGATGAITGSIKKQQMAKMSSELNQRIQMQKQQQMNDYISSNPQVIKGDPNAQYFENGGPMATNFIASQKAYGGSMDQQSSDGTIANGQTHEEGGIKMPGINAEVEDGETTKDNYVFSKQLGFADLHKPIMKAKGNIEKKPFTPERANAIKLLSGREDRLKLAQEFAKSQMGMGNESTEYATGGPMNMFPDGGSIGDPTNPKPVTNQAPPAPTPPPAATSNPNNLSPAQQYLQNQIKGIPQQVVNGKVVATQPSTDTPLVDNKGRDAWNKYVDYLGTQKLAGDPKLDQGGYGYQVLNNYMKANPNSGLTPDNVGPIQKDMQNYRNWSLQQAQTGGVQLKDGTESFMRDISKVDGYPGSLTTKHKFSDAYLHSFEANGKMTITNKGAATQQTQLYKMGGLMKGYKNSKKLIA